MTKRRLLALFMALVMILGLMTACSGGSGSGGSSSGKDTEGEGGEGQQEASSDTPLVVGYSSFSSKFSPFFSETEYDKDASDMTQIYLIDNDRLGQIVYHGIEGETYEYNGTEYTYTGPADVDVTENADGTVYYDITLRDDITFSDGEPMTIDDVIFSMYVYCDPTYDGSTTLFSTKIEGLEEYRSGVKSLFALIEEAGPDNTDFTYWTEEQQKAFWEAYDKAGEAIAQEIVDVCKSEGYNAEDDSVAACAANWGYELAEDATAADFYKAMLEAYDGSLADMIGAETAGSAIGDVFDGYEEYLVGVETGDSAPNITGIQKTGDYSMRIVATEVDATMIYQLGVAISPLHYYGDESLYDYDNNQFGFPKGDLSSVRAKTTEPMGAGPYKFVKFDNGVISFEANENYYKGAPKTKYINFREVNEQDKLNGILTGDIDITDPSYNKDVATAIAKENGGEATGEKITTDTVDNLGYGYIGINTHNVSVG